MEMSECLNTCSSITDTLSQCSRSRPQPILLEREKCALLMQESGQTVSEIPELLLDTNRGIDSLLTPFSMQCVFISSRLWLRLSYVGLLLNFFFVICLKSQMNAFIIKKCTF